MNRNVAVVTSSHFCVTGQHWPPQRRDEISQTGIFAVPLLGSSHHADEWSSTPVIGSMRTVPRDGGEAAYCVTFPVVGGGGPIHPSSRIAKVSRSRCELGATSAIPAPRRSAAIMRDDLDDSDEIGSSHGFPASQGAREAAKSPGMAHVRPRPDLATSARMRTVGSGPRSKSSGMSPAISRARIPRARR